MQNLRRWLPYDTFKLVVALLLLALFIILLLNPGLSGKSSADLALPPYPSANFEWTYDAASGNLLDPTGNPLYVLDPVQKEWKPVIPADLQADLAVGYQQMKAASGAWMIQNSAGETLFQWDPANHRWKAAAAQSAPSATPPPPTPAPTEEPVATLEPTPAPTEKPAATLEPTPAPTEELTATATIETAAETPAPTPTPETAAEATSAPAGECAAPAPSRLTAGGQARIVSNLNLRSAPGIGDNLIRVNPVGMVLKVIEGPQCLPYQGSAYLWWKVESPDGLQGWSAENRLNGSAYYLEPVQ